MASGLMSDTTGQECQSDKVKRSALSVKGCKSATGGIAALVGGVLSTVDAVLSVDEEHAAISPIVKSDSPTVRILLAMGSPPGVCTLARVLATRS